MSKFCAKQGEHLYFVAEIQTTEKWTPPYFLFHVEATKTYDRKLQCIKDKKYTLYKIIHKFWLVINTCINTHNYDQSWCMYMHVNTRFLRGYNHQTIKHLEGTIDAFLFIHVVTPSHIVFLAKNRLNY